MLATMTLSGLGVATALNVPFQNFSKSCFSPSCWTPAVLPCDPRDRGGTQGPSWSEHGGCIFGPKPNSRSYNLMEPHAHGQAVAEELSKYWIKLHRKRSNCCCAVFSSHSSGSMCQRVCLLSALEGERGDTHKSWPSPAGGWVLFPQMREGGVGEIVFLPFFPPLLSRHICCFLGTGLGVAELPRAPAPISSFTQNQASLTGDGACFSPWGGGWGVGESPSGRLVSVLLEEWWWWWRWYAAPALGWAGVKASVQREGAGECVRNRVRSSAESGLFCVSQPVTSKLGAGRWGEGHLLTICLSASLLVRVLSCQFQHQFPSSSASFILWLWSFSSSSLCLKWEFLS